MASSATATVRGAAYLCGSNLPLAGADVRLTNLQDHRAIMLRSDARGRFVRVGVDAPFAAAAQPSTDRYIIH